MAANSPLGGPLLRRRPPKSHLAGQDWLWNLIITAFVVMILCCLPHSCMERPDSQSLEVGIAGPGITLFRLQDEVELHMEDVKSFKNNNPF